MRISVLTPKLPPAVCGIADHGFLLGEALERLGAEAQYLAPCHGTNACRGKDAGSWDGTADGLHSAIQQHEADVLWIQYSGYGYSKKGIPVALARAIEQVAKARSRPLIVACMHETHASRTGLGWRAPIIQPLQISVARRIVRAADLVFAAAAINVERCIHEYGAPREMVELLPIASNLPNIEISADERRQFRERLGLSAGSRVAVTFGLWSSQIRAITLFENELQSALQRGCIEHIVAIGGETTPSRMDAVSDSAKVFNGRMSVLGPASAVDVARVLGCCDIGLVPTPRDYLRKSGAAAAFAAADLQIWMKDAGGKTVVETDIEAFPTWDQIAATAFESMNSRLEIIRRAIR